MQQNQSSNATATAAPETPSAVTTGIQRAQELLEQLATTEGRLVVSVVLFTAMVLVALLLLPFGIRQIQRFLASRYMSGEFGDAVDTVAAYVPTSFSGLALVLTQLTVILLTLLAFLVVWGLTEWAVQIVEFVRTAVPWLGIAGVSLALIVLGFAASEQLKQIVDRVGEGSDNVTEHQEEIVIRVGQVAIVVTVTSAILTLWGIDLSGLLVGAGFLGIVVGLAARQTLGSLIAGFVLMFSRPFTIGDWIVVGEDEGIVTDITIFNTRLENFDGEFIIIPNDRVADQPLTNRSQKGLLRLTVDVGIDYEADVDHAMALARETMADVEHVIDSPPPQVIPKDFGDSAVVLELRFWIDHPTPPRKWRAISAVVREVKSAFDEEGISIPFPQRTISERPGDTAAGPIDSLGTEQSVDGDRSD